MVLNRSILATCEGVISYLKIGGTVLPAFVGKARDAKHPAIPGTLVRSGPWKTRCQDKLGVQEIYWGKITVKKKGKR